MDNIYIRPTIIIILSIAISNAVYYYCKGKKETRRKETKREVHEVIMFSQEDTLCKDSKLTPLIHQSLDRLIFYLSSPKYSLDICMYVLTSTELANVLLKLHNKRVKIRIIIDADMAFSTGSRIRRLEKHGIQVRWKKSTNLMHHKFCLIDTACVDEKVIPLVMLGSLNWTSQAIHNHWEDVAVTSQQELVQQYSLEFERLWHSFKPIVDYKK